MMSPCLDGNIISLPHTPGRYAGSCTGCTTVTEDASFSNTVEEYFNNEGKQQKWEVVDASNITKGAIALKNLASGRYLGRCASVTCEKRSSGYPEIKPVISTEKKLSSRTTWSCVNVAYTPGKGSGYKWVLSGGSGLFLGRASSPLYKTPQDQKERADYGIFQYKSTVQSNNITVAGGSLVFSDIQLIHDAQAMLA